jgi:hypothetical protein
MRSVLVAFATVLTLAAAVPAQSDNSFSVSENLMAGGTATVSYSDPNLAGMTIIVEIDNGSQANPQFDYVTITLDANGVGSENWNVPDSGWRSATFNAPEAPAQSRAIGKPKPVVE